MKNVFFGFLFPAKGISLFVYGRYITEERDNGGFLLAAVGALTCNENTLCSSICLFIDHNLSIVCSRVSSKQTKQILFKPRRTENSVSVVFGLLRLVSV